MKRSFLTFGKSVLFLENPKYPAVSLKRDLLKG
jgi:hypothetical protein